MKSGAKVHIPATEPTATSVEVQLSPSKWTRVAVSPKADEPPTQTSVGEKAHTASKLTISGLLSNDCQTSSDPHSETASIATKSMVICCVLALIIVDLCGLVQCRDCAIQTGFGRVFMCHGTRVLVLRKRLKVMNSG